LENRAEPAKLALFCGCGRRPVELKKPYCCRPCYCRRYRSLRFFGGLREVVLKRDRFRCRACGASARLVVHHRSGDNQKRRLITLCIGCHTRVHRYRALRSWVPEVLIKLWREWHPSEPVQLQLPLGIRHGVSRSAASHRKKPDPSGREISVRFMGAARLSVGLDIEFQPAATTGNRTHIFGARTMAETKPASAVTV
jgi:hypothetical protein